MSIPGWSAFLAIASRVEGPQWRFPPSAIIPNLFLVAIEQVCQPDGTCQCRNKYETANSSIYFGEWYPCPPGPPPDPCG
jgi:hypothetical protein